MADESKEPSQQETNVVDFDEHRPHVCGIARCSECRQKWVAVVLLATANDPLECPNCRRMEGHIL
jgi:hypothetical protein